MRPTTELQRRVAPFEVVSDFQPAGDQPKAIDELARRIKGGDQDVVLLGATGTGKSATTAWLVEQVQRPTLVMAPNKTLAAQLANAHHDVEMVMVSRHGRLPLVHEPAPPAPVLPFPAGPGPLRELLAAVRRRLHADGDWREVVESLKISGNALWAGLSYADQERFVSHLARSWEIARHRMTPPMAAIIEGLLLDAEAQFSGVTVETVIGRLLDSVAPPTDRVA